MAAVFSGLGKMPDASELLTICRRSLSTEVKTVFKGKILKILRKHYRAGMRIHPNL